MIFVKATRFNHLAASLGEPESSRLTFETPILLARLGGASDLRDRAMELVFDFLPKISAARFSFFLRKRSEAISTIVMLGLFENLPALMTASKEGKSVVAAMTSKD